MIYIFRKIRKNILLENKVGVYFKYAIGEILLVVIGILIALQINAWGDERYNKKQEKYYLNQLWAEFESNLKESERNLRFCDFQSKNAALLLKGLDETLSEKESKDWFYAITQLGFTPKVNYIDNIWKEIISTNKLEIIKNKELIEKISGHYSSLEFIKKMELETQRSNIEFRAMVNEVLEHQLRLKIQDEFVSMWMVGRDLYSVEVYADYIPSVQQYLEVFKGIARIEGKTSDIQLDRKAMHMEHVKVKNNIIELIDQLSMELNY